MSAAKHVKYNELMEQQSPSALKGEQGQSEPCTEAGSLYLFVHQPKQRKVCVDVYLGLPGMLYCPSFLSWT